MLYNKDAYEIFYAYNTQLLDTYYKDSLVNSQKMVYEEITKGQKEVKDKNVIYRIGKLKNKLIKIEGDKGTVLYQSTWIKFLFGSNMMSSIMTAMVVLIAFIKWILIRKISI